MSGGHFDYRQGQVTDLAWEVDEIINNKSNNFRPETLDKMRVASATLRRAAHMLQRIDWLASGDDGEDSFHRRWEEEKLS